MGNQRPLDVLDAAKGDRVIAQLKNGDQISGTLRAFDLHLNMWLEDAEMDGEEATKQFGKLLVRGDNVVVVSPA